MFPPFRKGAIDSTRGVRKVFVHGKWAKQKSTAMISTAMIKPLQRLSGGQEYQGGRCSAPLCAQGMRWREGRTRKRWLHYRRRWRAAPRMQIPAQGAMKGRQCPAARQRPPQRCLSLLLPAAHKSGRRRAIHRLRILEFPSSWQLEPGAYRAIKAGAWPRGRWHREVGAANGEFGRG